MVHLEAIINTKNKLYGEKDSKYDIENIKGLSVQLELIVEFHGNTESIDQNHGKDTNRKLGRVVVENNFFCFFS